MPWLPTRDGHRLHVRVVGRGAPCLLLHGLGMRGSSWLTYVAPLLPWYRFIVPDLRGFGRSGAVPFNQPCFLTNYAEDVEDVLSELGISRLPVVGISMGASTALQSFRVLGGKRFSRYLHIDQGPIIRNDPGRTNGLLGREQDDLFALWRSILDGCRTLALETPYAQLPGEVRAALAKALGEVASRSFTSPMRDIVRWLARKESWVRRTLHLERWPMYVHILRAYLEQDYDMRETIRHIQVPMTVIVGGASDLYPPEEQRSIAALAPNARLVELPGVGHYVLSEAPFRFLVELWRFLREPERALPAPAAAT